MDEEELQEIEKMMKGLRDEAEMRGGDAYRMYGSFAPDVRRLISALRETKAAHPEGATGWRLVPTEATAEMVQAAEDRHVEGASYIAENSIQFAIWREVWRAMLSAAPLPQKDQS